MPCRCLFFSSAAWLNQRGIRACQKVTALHGGHQKSDFGEPRTQLHWQTWHGGCPCCGMLFMLFMVPIFGSNSHSGSQLFSKQQSFSRSVLSGCEIFRNSLQTCFVNEDLIWKPNQAKRWEKRAELERFCLEATEATVYLTSLG